MKRIFKPLFMILLLSFLLSGCGNKTAKEDQKALNDYKKNIESIFSDIEAIDEEIKSLNPNDEASVKKLFDELEKLDKAYASLSELTVPEKGAPDTFTYIPGLSKDASSYMSQALEYFNSAFTNDSVSENTLNAAYECYNRANKRLLYIVDCLHGNLPEGNNVSYE